MLLWNVPPYAGGPPYLQRLVLFDVVIDLLSLGYPIYFIFCQSSSVSVSHPHSLPTSLSRLPRHSLSLCVSLSLSLCASLSPPSAVTCLTVDDMLGVIMSYRAPGALTTFNRILQSYAAEAEVSVVPESPSQTLCNIALLNLSAAVRCQASLARVTALTEAVYGGSGGGSSSSGGDGRGDVDGSSVVAAWQGLLDKVGGVLTKSMRALASGLKAWDAAAAKARQSSKKAPTLQFGPALVSTHRFREFVAGTRGAGEEGGTARWKIDRGREGTDGRMERGRGRRYMRTEGAVEGQTEGWKQIIE